MLESKYIAPIIASKVLANIESRRQPPLFNSPVPSRIFLSSEFSLAIKARVSFLTNIALSLVRSPSAASVKLIYKYSAIIKPSMASPRYSSLSLLSLPTLRCVRAISNNYKKKYLPPSTFVEKLKKKFSPYCSVATWYLWRSIDNEPIQY